jgi:hypothetical protein
MELRQSFFSLQGVAEDKPTGSEVSESAATNSSSALSHQQIILTER